MNLQYLTVDKPKPELNLVVNSIKTTSISNEVREKKYGSADSENIVANTAAPLPIYLDYIPGPPELKGDTLVAGEVYTYKFSGTYKTNGAGQTILFQTDLGSTGPVAMPDSGGVLRQYSLEIDFYIGSIGVAGAVYGRYKIYFGQAVGSVVELVRTVAFPDTTAIIDAQVFVYFGVAHVDNLLATSGALLVG